MTKLNPYKATDEFGVEMYCDEAASHPGVLFIRIESPDATESIQLTREQASRLRDWIEHEFLDKV